MSDSPPPPQSPSGWYADPSEPGGQRYWNGKEWTDHTSPPPPPTAGQTAASTKEQEATGTIIAGYIFAVIIPLVGFIIGLTQINRNRHGIWVVVLSVVAFVIWLAIVHAATASHTCTTPYGNTYSC